MNIEFGTKAETLEVLKRAGFNVPELYFFNFTQWRENSALAINAIQQAFGTDEVPIIVRSSSLAEDSGNASQAGAFESILGINPANEAELRAAIERVFASFDGSTENQVLIQPMVKDIEVSGVIMTRSLEDGSPYYVINYDDESGKTDSITGGTGASKTLYIYKGVSDEDFDSPKVRKMMKLVRDLEKVFPNTPLDIEFGLDKNKDIHLFQVRRICTTERWNPDVENIVSDKIAFVEKFVSRYLKRRTGVYGEKSILGVMPDWNPAEIIGVTPRPLAASLYREIITRRTWSKAREMMGYRKMPPEELMILVAGRPYIDVRNSFNSFLPDGINPKSAEKLINGWIARLDNNPQFHDKIEFEIASTIYDPCFEDDFKSRYPDTLSDKEFSAYRNLLVKLTNENLRPGGSLDQALEKISILAEQQSGYPDFDSQMEKLEILSVIKLLLEEGTKYGTIPFSIIARHGFIAETFLRAIIRKNGLSAERVTEFKRSVETVSGQMSREFKKVCTGELDEQTFMKNYGHLRPGTYDILSPKYSDRKEIFSKATELHGEDSQTRTFTLSTTEKSAVAKILADSGITTITADEFLRYAEKAIAGREYAKFIFTRNLSNALEGLTLWGSKIGLNKEEISLLNLRDILDSLYSQLDDKTREHFIELAKRGKRQYELGASFKLSYLIRSDRDIYIVPQHRCTPNFITDKTVEAEIIKLNNSSTKNNNLDGKVVCIESADPGFDWIFTRNIKGLITKYGGTNSHMAIRCAEYNLPAAIGCGEMLYEKITNAKLCILNAAQKSVTPYDSSDF